MRCRAGDNEGMQVNVGVGKSDLDLLDSFVEVNLRVGDADVSDAFRVHENDVLFGADEQP